MIIHTRKKRRKRNRLDRKKSRANQSVMAFVNKEKALMYADSLKESATRHELLLIAKLDSLGILYHFQYPFHSNKACYIADFYFPYAARKRSKYIHLIVELDGPSHDLKRQKEHDRKRSVWLRMNGCLVVRFPNGQVEHDIDSVIKSIRWFTDTLERPMRKLIPIDEFRSKYPDRQIITK